MHGYGKDTSLINRYVLADEGVYLCILPLPIYQVDLPYFLEEKNVVLYFIAIISMATSQSTKICSPYVQASDIVPSN